MNPRTTLALATKLIVGLALFSVITGFRGCTVSGGSGTYSTYTAPPPDGSVIVSGPGTPAPGPVSTPVVYVGDLALTIYAPAYSPVTPDTASFNVTIREGGAFGPVVLQGNSYALDIHGAGALDLLDLPYGYYDVEVVGLDFLGNAVSHAATGVSIDEPLTSLVLDLEAVDLAGDVVLEVYEPDGGIYSGPIDTIDYLLWELDPVTGQLIFVEQMNMLPFNPWQPPTIASLGLGDYYIEVFAYDSYGYEIYQFGAEFAHSGAVTYLPVQFWYSN